MFLVSFASKSLIAGKLINHVTKSIDGGHADMMEARGHRGSNLLEQTLVTVES